MSIYFSLLVCIIGALVYALTKDNAKVQELGRVAYAMGLLAFLLQFGPIISTLHR